MNFLHCAALLSSAIFPRKCRSGYKPIEVGYRPAGARILPLSEVRGLRGEPWLEAVALGLLCSGDADSTVERESHTVVAMKRPVVDGRSWP